jgi:KDO2-lipid IV(A) lauroyltransferase
MRARAVRAIVALLAALPWPVLHGLGWLIGRGAARCSSRAGLIADINLRVCLPRLSETERNRLWRRSLIENARTLIEMPKMWRGDPERWASLVRPVTPDNEELPRRALAQGKGLLVIAPHLGNWEVGILYLPRIAPVTALYRPPREKAMADIMLAGRSAAGGTLVPTSVSGIKTLYQALKRGEIVCILPDQQPKGGEGGGNLFVPFFGHQALTITLLSRLARKSGAPVLSLFYERLPGRQGFRQHWLQPPQAIYSSDEKTSVAAMNQAIEECIAICPEQYQWSYKRFATRPPGMVSLYP